MIGSALKQIRQSNRLSQDIFGALLGVHRTTVSDWERGITPVPTYAELVICLVDDHPELLPTLERIRGLR